MLRLWLAYAPQYQRGILRPKRNAVAHCVLDLRRAANFRDVVQIAVRIGLFQINRRRNLVVLHGDERSGDTRGAAGALRVSNLGLERRHWDLVSMVAQRQLERA